jgi:hypothetical protein
MENSPTAPEIVIRDGEPVVILSLGEYRELLEKAEDLEALRHLEEMRQMPLKLRHIDDIAPSEALDALSSQFEELLESMQTPEAKKGVDAAFNATPEELGRAAVKAARRRS